MPVLVRFPFFSMSARRPILLPFAPPSPLKKPSPRCGFSEAPLGETISSLVRKNRSKVHCFDNRAPVRAGVRNLSGATGRILSRPEERQLCGLGVQAPAVAEGRGGEVERRAAVMCGEEDQGQGPRRQGLRQPDVIENQALAHCAPSVSCRLL